MHTVRLLLNTTNAMRIVGVNEDVTTVRLCERTATCCNYFSLHYCVVWSAEAHCYADITTTVAAAIAAANFVPSIKKQQCKKRYTAYPWTAGVTVKSNRFLSADVSLSQQSHPLLNRDNAPLLLIHHADNERST
jgi:hypothetical protein